MAPTDIARLTEAPGELKRRPDGARYYDGEQIITHLNYALGPWGWDWAELDGGTDAETDEVWVLGQLSARFILSGPDGTEQVVTTTKIERGWQKVNRLRDGTAKAPGDDRKGAATDALKRCARLLGVGLDAWAKTPAALGSPARIAQPASTPALPVDAGAPPVEPLSPSDRLAAVARYLDLLAQAQAQARPFRASWTTAEPRRWSDVQLAKYCSLLEQYISRQEDVA